MINLTHRRHEASLNNGFAILFCDNDENAHYGDHVWTLNSDLPLASDSEQLVSFTADYYSVSVDEAAELVNPSRIVDTAGAWDDQDFVSELWQAMEQGQLKEVAGYRTNDGAVVIDLAAVELTYSQE